MQELLPLGAGLLLGMLLGVVKPALRLPLGVGLAAVLGLLATVVTGEARISWSYVLIDIPIVGIGAVIGVLTGQRLRRVSGDASG